MDNQERERLYSALHAHWLHLRTAGVSPEEDRAFDYALRCMRIVIAGKLLSESLADDESQDENEDDATPTCTISLYGGDGL